VVGHAKGHHRLDAGTGVALDLGGQFLLRDTLHAGHAGDRHEVVDFFFDENRQHQIVEGELGFLEQATQLRGAAQAAWASLGELAGHGGPEKWLKTLGRKLMPTGMGNTNADDPIVYCTGGNSLLI